MIQSCYSKIFPVKARKTHDMESCKEADIEENVELGKESLQEIEFVSIGEQDSVVESIFDSKDEEYDVLLTLLDTETDEVDTVSRSPNRN